MYSLRDCGTLAGVTDTPRDVPYVPGPPMVERVTPWVPDPVSGRINTGVGRQQRLVQIGEISVDDTTVYTPVGTLDRRYARWSLGAATPVSESCPNWAQALAILLIPCTAFLSLLFLLFKETDSWSSPLRVTDGRISYDTTVYSRSTSEYLKIRNAVTWAQQAPGQPGPYAPYALPPGA